MTLAQTLPLKLSLIHLKDLLPSEKLVPKQIRIDSISLHFTFERIGVWKLALGVSEHFLLKNLRYQRMRQGQIFIITLRFSVFIIKRLVDCNVLFIYYYMKTSN